MDEGNQSAAWQKAGTLPLHSRLNLTNRQLIEVHQRQLEEHHNFLSSLRAAQSVSGAKEFVEECLTQTEAMVKNFKHSADRFLVANGERMQDNSYRPKKQIPTRPRKNIPTGPSLDPSGLFMKDTKPTPIEELMGHPTTSAVIRTKRKFLESDEPIESTLQPPEPEEHAQKKLRREVISTPKPELSEESSIPNGHKPGPPDEPVEVPAAGDSFLQEVEEHLKKKELKRLKKQEKKRRRESGISDISMTGVGQDNTQTIPKPEKKRRKKVNYVAVEQGEVDMSSRTPSHSEQTTPQVEKGKNKRLSPASEYIASLGQQVDSRRKSKRQRTAEVA